MLDNDEKAPAPTSADRAGTVPIPPVTTVDFNGDNALVETIPESTEDDD